MGEVKGTGCGNPWGIDCGRSFKLMDLSFPGRRSHFLSVCLSPALLLNQGEWSYLLALTREGDTGGGLSGEGHGLKLPFQVRFEAG